MQSVKKKIVSPSCTANPQGWQSQCLGVPRTMHVCVDCNFCTDACLFAVCRGADSCEYYPDVTTEKHVDDVPVSDKWVLGFKSLLLFQLLPFFCILAHSGHIMDYFSHSTSSPSSSSNMCSVYLSETHKTATQHLDRAVNSWQAKAIMKLCVGALQSTGDIPHFRAWAFEALIPNNWMFRQLFFTIFFY